MYLKIATSVCCYFFVVVYKVYFSFSVVSLHKMPIFDVGWWIRVDGYSLAKTDKVAGVFFCTVVCYSPFASQASQSSIP